VSGKTGRGLMAELGKNGVPRRAAFRHSEVPFDWTEPATRDHARGGISAGYLVAPGMVSDPCSRMIEFLEHEQPGGLRPAKPDRNPLSGPA
jgi:hypothetical protein